MSMFSALLLHWAAAVSGLYKHIFKAITGSLFEPKVTGSGAAPPHVQHDEDIQLYRNARWLP